MEFHFTKLIIHTREGKISMSRHLGTKPTFSYTPVYGHVNLRSHLELYCCFFKLFFSSNLTKIYVKLFVGIIDQVSWDIFDM